ncbi:hypothetical protein NIIDNTM18_42820 [Mycolicibacterium litorale]|uniref:Uncharacterized protein n=1 Tax=Mycolicibacterium litorale TaxID=758802 RepID=A0A6S6P8L8_9MYCO|nr:hypothetical protein [Mycolicibacterium litorale]BCI55004.1 hypothetical protein NIIDNTM18_42820 [Mycolicibacterium litorale]
MSASLPNQLKISGPGERSYIASFGTLRAALPAHHVRGLGHIEHIEAHCDGGVFMRLTADEATRWVRKLLKALEEVPDFPDCSGALAFIPEVDR